MTLCKINDGKNDCKFDVFDVFDKYAYHPLMIDVFLVSVSFVKKKQGTAYLKLIV